MERLIVFYDARCYICVKEIEWLKETSNENTDFQDLNNPNCLAYSLGFTPDELRAKIHGFLNGEIISGLKVFREMYIRSGKNYLAWTALPVLSFFADMFYILFARNRRCISRFVAKVFKLKLCKDRVCKF